MHTFKPSGVCSRSITINIDDNNLIQNVTFEGGCHGNLQGISRLVAGRPKDEIISKLSGIKCGDKQTSCPDQLSIALMQIS